jgi:hypothetical protein
MWVNDNMPTKEFWIKKSEGRRDTVLHAGSSAGFLDGCSLFLLPVIITEIIIK